MGERQRKDTGTKRPSRPEPERQPEADGKAPAEADIAAGPALAQPSIEAHAGRLGDEQVQTTQRRRIAGRIQKTGGNRYMQRVVRQMKQSGPGEGTPVQAKMSLNEAGDSYEQEADQVAEAVTRLNEGSPADEAPNDPAGGKRTSPAQAPSARNDEASGDEPILMAELAQLVGQPQPTEQAGLFFPIQRHSAETIEYEADSIQAKRLADGLIQRHSSEELEFEEDSIQAKRLPWATLQRDLIDELNEAMDGWGADAEAIMAAIDNASESEKEEALNDPRIVARLRDELSRTEAIEALTALGAPLSLRLETALDGWGAASEQILEMIESGEAAEKQAVLQNPSLMSRLRNELSSEDAIEALAGLGAPLSERLHAAMDGWGVDEAAIRALLEEATDEEKEAAVHDRALIDRLKREVSSESIQEILEEMGASLVDRLNVAMDGWGVDAAAVIAMTSSADEADKEVVLGDSATISRLSSELSREDALTVFENLGLSLADRLNVAMDGWGADAEAIKEMIPTAGEDERLAVYGDSGTMGRLEGELSEEDFQQVKLLLRFGSQEAIDAATEEELADESLPDNLTALLSGEMDQDSPDSAKMLQDIEEASEEDRALVWRNHALMERLAGVLDPEQMREAMALLGVSIVDRLNLLLAQEADAAEVLALIENCGEEEKQLILDNRALLERLLVYLGAESDQDILAALGDSLANRLNQALNDGAAVETIFELIEAAEEADWEAVRVNSVLMNRMAGSFPPMTYWRIRLHLAFGSLEHYPDGLAELIDDWEADASFDNIRLTIANLDTPTFEGIKDVVGIRETLAALVSGEDYVFLLRMLDQGLITTEEDISARVPETLQVDDPDTPELDFVSKQYVATQGFDAAYFRDRVQVDVRVSLNPLDDDVKAKIPELESRWESGIEGVWDNVYSLQNSIHTLAIRVDCNFTDSDPHHDVDVRGGPARSNQGLWDTEDTGRVAAHEFGHMLGNPDEYDLAPADYETTVGIDPDLDPDAVKETDDAGNERFDNPSVMGSNVGPNPDDAGSVEPRHLNYFVNWINQNRRRNSDGSFAEPAFTLV